MVILPFILYSLAAEILKQIDEHVCPIDRKEEQPKNHWVLSRVENQTKKAGI